MIRGVLFDLDDTLFDHSYCARAALDGVRAAHGCFAALPAEVVEQAHTRILDELHVHVATGKLPIDDARAERFRRLFETAGVAADANLAASAASIYRRGYLESWRVVAGAVALLAELKKRGVSIAVISNNLLEEQQQKLRQCGLEPYVDALVVSGEVGISKPETEIFQIALQQLAARPDEAVMVGDSWSADIVGAVAAGIPAVWFNRHREPQPSEPKNVLLLETLEPAARVAERIVSLRKDAR